MVCHDLDEVKVRMPSDADLDLSESIIRESWTPTSRLCHF